MYRGFQQSEEVVELLDASQNSSMSGERTIFLGFISAENSNSNDADSNDDFSSVAYSE